MSPLLVFFTTLILSSIGHLATDIYLPSMPAIAEYFDTTATAVQLTFSAYLLSYCFTPLVIGPLSDHIGRKRPIMVGMIISLFATLLCSFSTSIHLLIAGRFLQGIGFGTITSASRALLPDHFQGKELTQYYSYIGMSFPILLAMGPLLGGIIQDHSSWRIVFIFLLLYLLVLLIFFKFTFSEHKDSKTKKVESYFNYRVYGKLFKNKKLILFAMCPVLIFMGISAYLNVGSFLFQKTLGLTPTESGILAVFVCAVTAAFGFVNSRLVARWDARKVLMLFTPCVILSGISLNLFYFNDTVTVITLLFSILLYFSAVPGFFSNATSLALSQVSGHFGAATALLSCLQFVGGVIGSLLVSFSTEITVLPLSIVFTGVGIGCFILLSVETSMTKRASMTIESSDMKSETIKT